MSDELESALIEDDGEADCGGASEAVLRSLKKMRAARAAIKSLASADAAPSALLSQIELCNVLLGEIRAISRSLDKRPEHPKVSQRRQVTTRRHRSTAHPIVPRRSLVGRARQHT
ncbi:hypothetical protein [Bradyrhizobium sp. HKCCYLR20261]|uniref:hypothetical protein n=1 Tax=Bradyrhizobium sp. HKCCYLR20261 TaxID=3420760 RepID=UPI003EBDEA87